MKENPYNDLLNIMSGVAGNNKSPTVQVGIVQTSPPQLTICYNGIILNNKDLFINTFLLTNYYREYKGHIVSATQDRAGGGGYAEFASHNHDIDNDYKLTSYTTDTLKAGDKVALMPMVSEDGSAQKYIVMFKVVRPDWSDVNDG